MKIYLIRHGETDWNVLRKFQGCTDIPLNDKGRLLARKTAEAMKDIPFDAAFSSPLSRAMETARIIIGDRPVEVLPEPRLVELSFGEYEGIDRDFEGYEAFLYTFFKEPQNYKAPKGGETLEHLCERTTKYLYELAADERYQDATVLLATHGAALRGLLSSFQMNGDLRNFWGRSLHKNCAVSLLEARDGSIELLEEGKIYYEE